jgi:hypothetical protein
VCVIHQCVLYAIIYGNFCFFLDGITQDQELVYGAVDDYYMDKLLPDPGIWLAVEVTTILTPGHFYVSLPFGKTPTDNLKEKEGKCTNFMVW